MHKLTFVLSKLYWVLVAAVPFYPAYELFALKNTLQGEMGHQGGSMVGHSKLR